MVERCGPRVPNIKNATNPSAFYDSALQGWRSQNARPTTSTSGTNLYPLVPQVVELIQSFSLFSKLSVPRPVDHLPCAGSGSWFLFVAVVIESGNLASSVNGATC